jgi:L-threonylcarbamoyladenylate synthase
MTRVVSSEQLALAAATLRSGGVVAVPTETVYGLAAKAHDEAAVTAVFAAKRRPGDNPLIVHCADATMAFGLVRDVPEFARRLAARFWPGPLSLVLDSAVDWPWVQAGHRTLALRVPGPAFLRRLIAEVGPLAAPSANLSGRPSPTTAAHVLTDLDGVIPLVVDGGPCGVGLESTVVDCTGGAPRILRPGPVTAEQVAECLGDRGAGGDESVGHGVSPGTRHPHYTPRARVLLVDDLSAGGIAQDTMYIGPVAATLRSGLPRDRTRAWTSLETLAAELYGWFREADALGLARVVVQRVPPTGLGAAVMNRLSKAASEG